MTKKIILAVVFFCGFIFSAYAQSDLEDVVYFKNGAVIRGEILEIIPNKTLKIQTVDRNIFVYKLEEVIKIVKEPIPSQKSESVQVRRGRRTPRTSNAPSVIYKQDGFYNITKFGPLNLSGMSLNVINGYQFNPYFLLGLGVGLDVHKGLGSGDIDFSRPETDYFLPVYMDFRYYVSKTRATFFLFMNMGYSIYLHGDGRSVPVYNNNTPYYYNTYNVPNSGGAMYCTGIGTKVFLNKKVAVLVDFGFKLQTYEVTQYYMNYNNTTSTYDQAQRQTELSDVTPVLNFGFAF